jgi:transcriptional regulator with XRE-family HTH domain
VEPKEQFGRNLRYLRLKAELTQMELGNRADLDMSEISAFERGVRDVRLSTLARLAQALGVSAADLVDGVGRPG